MTTHDQPETASQWRRRLLTALPLLVFGGLAVLFFMRLGAGDPSKIPSALLGRPAPATTLPALEGLTENGAAVPGLTPDTFKGKVSVVNVWASWCVPCHDEAPLLHALSGDKRFQIQGTMTYLSNLEFSLGYNFFFGDPDKRVRDVSPVEQNPYSDRDNVTFTVKYNI